MADSLSLGAQGGMKGDRQAAAPARVGAAALLVFSASGRTRPGRYAPVMELDSAR